MAADTFPPYVGSPPQFRISVWFTQQGDLLGGWSENFWSTQVQLALAIGSAKALQTALLATKAPNIWSPRIRISSLANPRQVTKLAFSSTTNPAAAVTSSGVVPGVKALVALADNVGHYTTQWLGGMSYTQFDTNGTWSPTGGVTNALGNLYSVLAANQFAIRKVAPNKANQKTLSGLTKAGVATVVAHGLSTGDRVRIGRVVAGDGVNGIWTVTVVSADTFQLQGVGTGFSTDPVLNKSSYSVPYQYILYPIFAPIQNSGGIQQCGVLRATTHHIGRPPAQFSGRRRRRVA